LSSQTPGVKRPLVLIHLGYEETMGAACPTRHPGCERLGWLVGRTGCSVLGVPMSTGKKCDDRIPLSIAALGPPDPFPLFWETLPANALSELTSEADLIITTSKKVFQAGLSACVPCVLLATKPVTSQCNTGWFPRAHRTMCADGEEIDDAVKTIIRSISACLGMDRGPRMEVRPEYNTESS